MKVALKLYATLSDYLPIEARKTNRLDLEVEPGTTPQVLIERYALPQKLCHLVLIDGVFVPPRMRATRTLEDGEVLAIWPPVAGG
ncbi:MAG: MoaD/ThiS family protein [Rhodocyclaceae bacterium]|nr:MAG: MoaD/ThiS family protein [Rhodocyclaceae bacterium]